MKKLLFIIFLATISLRSMESSFQQMKSRITAAVTECTKIKDNDERFKQWKKEYERLFKSLPNNLEELDKLTKEEEEKYNNPIFPFLVHSKIKEITKQPPKQNNFSKWFSSGQSTADKSISPTPSVPPATNQQFEEWVIQAAQDYGLVLPYTELVNHIWLDKKIWTFEQLSYFNSSIKQFSKKITSIDLHYLSFLPEVLDEITSGKFIKLKLTTVPEDVSRLRNLNELKLYENNLDDLPESLVQLEQLKILYLDANQFKKLPAVIAQLKLLKTLSVGYNQLQEDPHTLISKLPCLSELDLSNNKLTSFEPQKFLPSLKKLNLGNNQITKLPSIPKLSLLQYLNVENNPLEESPYTLIESNYHLKKLVDVQGNTIEIKRPE